MKVAHALLSLFFLSPLAVEGATVNPLGRGLALRLSSDDPVVSVGSFSWLWSGLNPSPGTLYMTAVFPHPVYASLSANITLFWNGSVVPLQSGPHQYQVSGTFTGNTGGGASTLTLNNDGTWSCSGDCHPYIPWTNGQVRSSPYSLTTGTFRVEEMPLPAASGLLAAGMGLLGIVRRRGRRDKA